MSGTGNNGGPTLPVTWAEMVVTEDRSDNVSIFHVGWSWSNAEGIIVGDQNRSGTGKFGFQVFRNIVGGQSLSINKDEVFGGRVRYRVCVTNPSSVSDHTLPRLLLELYCLGYATSNRLARIGDSFFDGTAFGGTSSNIIFPVVTNISYDQEKEKDPSVWIITYTLERPAPTGGQSYRPSPGEKPVAPNVEENPWDMGPKVSVNFGSEDFVLGLGRFLGSRTPAEVGSALDNDTYASLFSQSGQNSVETEIVCNSANDPLESPPPMKVSNASISISRAYEALPSGFATLLTDGVEEVCSDAVSLEGVSFGAYTCKLGGASISTEKHRRSADWLPRQQHPFEQTYNDVGWVPPEGMSGGDVAYNFTKGVLPAHEYVTYYRVSVNILYRKLGWGYALVDKGYRKRLENGKLKEITDVSGRQTYVRILEEGKEADVSTGTSDKKVLRLYQVLSVGTNLTSVLNEIMGG